MVIKRKRNKEEEGGKRKRNKQGKRKRNKEWEEITEKGGRVKENGEKVMKRAKFRRLNVRGGGGRRGKEELDEFGDAMVMDAILDILKVVQTNKFIILLKLDSSELRPNMYKIDKFAKQLFYRLHNTA